MARENRRANVVKLTLGFAVVVMLLIKYYAF